MKITIDFRMHMASGIGVYIRNIVPFLVDDYQLTLLGDVDEIQKYDFSDKVNIIGFNSNIYSLREQIEFIIKVKPCDIFWSPHYNVPLVPVRARHRIVTIHDVFHLAYAKDLSPLKKLYSNLLLKVAVKKSDLIMTVSFFSKDEIKKYLAPPLDIEVVPCAVDFNIYNSKKLSSGSQAELRHLYGLPDKFILYVGNVKPHKNLIGLLKALSNHPEYNLVVVGKKDGFITGDSSIKPLLDSFPELKRRVYFTGFVRDDDLPAIYKMAEMFVFPSLYEGFGIPPLEAQASGCPVLSSSLASMPEVLKDSVLYFDAHNYLDIAEKIFRLDQDPDLKLSLIKNGENNVKRFDWKRSAKEIISFIERLE